VSLHARGEGGAEGLWYGGVPVAGAASHVAAPLRIPAGEARTLDVVAAGTHGSIYAEVDDEKGRVAARVLEAPRAALDLPPLADGVYWLVTSSEARGAETLTGGAVARPLLVGAEPRAACDVGALLAQSSAAGFPRAVALDGFAGRREQNRVQHRMGAAIGLGALAIAAMLETLLLVASARRGTADLTPALTRRNTAGSAAIAILAALLAFAFLAALLLYRPT
jgi:hypothetical protein